MQTKTRFTFIFFDNISSLRLVREVVIILVPLQMMKISHEQERMRWEDEKFILWRYERPCLVFWVIFGFINNEKEQLSRLFPLQKWIILHVHTAWIASESALRPRKLWEFINHDPQKHFCENLSRTLFVVLLLADFLCVLPLTLSSF